MNLATEERLAQDWEAVWMMIQDSDNTYEVQMEASAQMDNIIERFKSTLSEDQARAFKMLMDLRVETDLAVRVAGEDHYFKLGCLAAYGTLAQIRALINENPVEEEKRIAGIFDEYLQLAQV